MYQNLDFWHANMPSGNPARIHLPAQKCHEEATVLLRRHLLQSWNLAKRKQIKSRAPVASLPFPLVQTIEILITRTAMFAALVLQTFLVKKHPCKRSADLRPRQGNLLHFHRAQQNLSILHEIGWISAKKLPFLTRFF
jgi:hypothetical protein